MLLRNPLKPSFIKRMLFFGVIHFLVMLFLIFYSFGGSLEAFNDPDEALTGVEASADSTAKILVQPAHSLWNDWMSKNMPDFSQWALFGLNSLLWGFVISYFLSIIFRL